MTNNATLSETQQSLLSVIENELVTCRNDIDYFFDTYGHIEVKGDGELIRKFELWPEQRNTVHSILGHRLNAILKARQLGFSWLMVHIAAWLMLGWNGRTVIALSRTEEEAKELVRRVEVVLTYAPELIRPIDNCPAWWPGPKFRRTALTIEIYHPNNAPLSVMKAFPSSPNAGRSFTGDLLIMDEWAFQDFAEDIWTAAFPTINGANGGRFIGLSTIKRGSLFEKIYTDDGNGFNKIFIPWYADPSRDKEWYENTKRAMADPAMMLQEYPATVEEALTVPGGSYFPEVNDRNTISDEDLIEKNEGRVLRYVALDYGLDMFSAHWIAVDHRGNAQVYREYDRSNMTISEAAANLISACEGEEIELFLAPPDLWNRSQESGKSRADLWQENGVNLTKTSNDFAAGCAGMKEWLKPKGDNQKSRLTILRGAAPNLYNCLRKIQKDDKKPNVYAKKPHDLTHDPDSLRYFCVWWTATASAKDDRARKRWTQDIWDDYDRASDEERELIIAKYGEPLI